MQPYSEKCTVVSWWKIYLNDVRCQPFTLDLLNNFTDDIIVVNGEEDQEKHFPSLNPTFLKLQKSINSDVGVTNLILNVNLNNKKWLKFTIKELL